MSQRMAPTDQELGALLGVFVGDAAGAPLEFARHVSEEAAKRAMHMPGGGVLHVGPGQITDDGELTLALYHTLQKHAPSAITTDILEDIARAYVDWYASDPFDMGSTCRRAFSEAFFHRKEHDFASEAMLQAAQSSITSEANGALMRIVPMAIWSRNLPRGIVAFNARQDALLSHPSRVTQDCNATYCIALVHLLNHPGDAQGAFDAAREYAAESCCDTVQEWMDTDPMECCRVNIGHVKYAFILAMSMLKKRASFADSVCYVLRKGGDTDTNAAIVGGLIGALHGASSIPQYCAGPVLYFDCTLGYPHGNPRPVIYSPQSIRGLYL